jgi:hypothetical protein
MEARTKPRHPAVLHTMCAAGATAGKRINAGSAASERPLLCFAWHWHDGQLAPSGASPRSDFPNPDSADGVSFRATDGRMGPAWRVGGPPEMARAHAAADRSATSSSVAWVARRRKSHRRNNNLNNCAPDTFVSASHSEEPVPDS